MPRVTANGVTFHVQRLGAAWPAGAGDAPPVVMIHGLLLGTLASWYFTAAPALARRHHVFLYDLRGHGKSERVTTGYDVRTMTRDLFALTADYRPTPMILVGHSYGALVALRFALDHPDRVARLALAEAPLPPSRFDEWSAFLAQDPRAMVEALPESLRGIVARGGRQISRLVESLTFLTARTSLLSELHAEPDVGDAELARLRCPVLCAYGERSPCRSVGERLAQVVPDARLAVLAGGHYLHLDAPAALTDRLLELARG
jgi:pimeloyl-ACP methyl ester carboxylesterase